MALAQLSVKTAVICQQGVHGTKKSGALDVHHQHREHGKKKKNQLVCFV